MSKIPNKNNAEEVLQNFIKNGLSSYAYKRNYDYGHNKNSNVSKLSPFIRKRIIHEKDIITLSLRHFKYQDIEKFIQEVFWRVYWKGWLEGRNQVWKDYQENLKILKNEKLNSYIWKNYEKALAGKTGIGCFDSWVRDLLKYGYLHNHARMWFASIWIHTLHIPWELGANFFFENLFDADPASNTLSWRWVAGLQTQGKAYLAKKSNIEKFSHFTYDSNISLANSPINIDFQTYEFKNPTFPEKKIKDNDYFIISENNLIYSKEQIKLLKRLQVILINYENQVRDSSSKKKFNEIAISEYLSYLNVNKITYKRFNNLSTLNNVLKKTPTRSIFSNYPGIGYELDRFESYRKDGININYIFDNFDMMCWPHAKAGFFKFKLKIPKFIESYM